MAGEGPGHPTGGRNWNDLQHLRDVGAQPERGEPRGGRTGVSVQSPLRTRAHPRPAGTPAAMCRLLLALLAWCAGLQGSALFERIARQITCPEFRIANRERVNHCREDKVPVCSGETRASPDAGAASTSGAPQSGKAVPDFSQQIRNITVPVGREAVLSCSVTELGNYKVGWLKVEDQTILTLHNKVVTHNSRVSVSRDGDHTWRLHLRQVKEADRGCYMCQINTSVMKKQVGCVDVHVPPDIVDGETSSDVTVQEGENATMTCRAAGHPTPRILWRREGGEELVFRLGPRNVTRAESFSGEVLTLWKLERSQMGAYLCIATNDVPPAVSKRITLNINFAPVVKVPNQILGAPFGTNVTLECYVEAFPNTINYWLKNRGEMLMDGKKHVLDETRSAYKVVLKLTLLRFGRADVGTYTCVSTNSLGRADGTVRLYEIKLQTSAPIRTTTKPPVTLQDVTIQRRVEEMVKDSAFTTIVSLQEAAMDRMSEAQDARSDPGGGPGGGALGSGARRGGAGRALASLAAQWVAAALVRVAR
ncbi:lachesin-like [Bacillus rossius redtenbacheri]|uniref:lachesin-like n=1 Tax=Bacillus rossius redtenbacheri TaxID=93214 RepID=UPI002FDE29D8